MRSGWIAGATACLLMALCGCATTGPTGGTAKSPFVGKWVAESVPAAFASQKDAIESVGLFIADDGYLTLSVEGKDGSPIHTVGGTWEKKAGRSIGFALEADGEKIAATAQEVGAGRILVSGGKLDGYFRKK